MDMALRLLLYFPKLAGSEENKILYSEISKEEFQVVIGTFHREKSLGPNGWKEKFFEGFFDTVDDDLLRVVEGIQKFRKFLGSINSNFITLIPKVECLSTFIDFCPIALCNFLYKIMEKMIAMILKPILSNCITSN